MKAAVVTSWAEPPHYTDFADAAATDPDEIVVDVLAAALHPRVRSQASGTHYTSTDDLPLVPGVDGVGRTADGTLRYFVLADGLGSLAEQTVIGTHRSVELPAGTDPVAVAAAMNPAMSSWLALKFRVDFQPGQDVLVLGATGAAGSLAVQVAKHFGAGRIIAAGRNAEKLAGLSALGATETIVLGDDPEQQAVLQTCADVDAVVDYLWGDVATTVMTAIVGHRPDRDRPLSWVSIGSMAGPDAAVPSAALRATPFRIVGSGQGSIGVRQILGELPAIAAAIGDGVFSLPTRTVPLSEVESTWNDTTDPDRRLVFVPKP